MISSSKSGRSGMHAPRRPAKKQGLGPYIMFVIVALLVVIIVLAVVFGGKKEGPAKASKSGNQGAELVTTREANSRVSKAEHRGRSTRRERRMRESVKEVRGRRREKVERKTSTKVSSRGRRGGYTVKRTGSPVLQAIIALPDGERVAVIGNRQVKRGDQVEGRRITEVGPDRVKVEYFTKSYEVKLNEPIY